jgi:SAM-dependent methyltransferase
MGDETPAFNSCFAELQSLFASPRDGAPLDFRAPSFVSAAGDRFPVAGNVADFYVREDLEANQVTETVKGFYETRPFPDYDDIDNREHLREKARLSVFASVLDAQLPRGATILEAGCGTGQLTNYLAMSPWRRVIGGDLSHSSLALAEDFRGRFEINNAAFVRMNIFRPPFKPESLDVIISNGVLHHTRDAKAAFSCLVEKLRPGGLIIIGLYNTYARIPTLARRALARGSRELAIVFDAHLRTLKRDSAKFDAWFADQYQHPAETRHSQGDVLAWFDENRIEFLSGIPHLDGGAFDAGSDLFTPRSRATPFRRALSQLTMLLENAGDGGLFIMIGRKEK